MKEEIIRYLELKDDPKNIEDFIYEECKKEVISVYVDYRDVENLERLIYKCSTLEDFKDYIYTCYEDYISEARRTLADRIATDLLKRYPDYQKIEGDLYWGIICCCIEEEVPIEIPMDLFIKSKIKVNIFLRHQKSDDSTFREFDYKTLYWLLRKLGYEEKPSKLVKKAKEENIKENEFLSNLHSEIINVYPNQYNDLCYIGEMSIEDYYKIKNDPKTKLLLPKDCVGGFVDRYNGGGSILNLYLPKEIIIDRNHIDDIYIEGQDKYSVDDIYGLTSQCYKLLETV